MIKPDDNILDYIDDYVNGLLSPQDAEQVERYCRETPIGKVALEEARTRFAAMQTIAPLEAPERLIRQTLERIERKAARQAAVRRSFLRTVMFAAAASVLITSAVHVYFYRLKPSPYDVRLLGQNALLSESEASLRIAVLNRDNQRPLAGVPLRLAICDRTTGQQVQLAQLTTDEHGTASPRFRLPSWGDGRYELRVVALPNGVEEILSQPIHVKREWQLMVSTDKPVYQPGQTIHVRALALRKPDRRPVGGQESVFTIVDPKGNVVFKQKCETSRFGISSADCPLASEIIEGAYKVQCAVGGTTSERSVTVEQYVLPKFRVNVTLDKTFYGPGELVAGSVQADYFFGKPVGGGRVAIEVRATDVEQRALATIDQTTDDHGKAKFQFALPDRFVGREQDAENARFLLVATVTDTAGQKHSAGTSRVVTANPIQVEVIPESGALVRGVANTVFVFTSYADGQPARTRLVVEGQRADIETSDMGVASLQVTPRMADVDMTVKATDAKGQAGRRRVQLRCSAVADDFLIRTDKAVYVGGETMRLVALGGGVEPVFVDFIKDSQTVLTAQLEMRQGRGQYEFDLPAELFGTLEICAYRFRSHGLAVRKSRTVFVQQARQLSVQATLDQSEYRPGSQATVKLRISDPDGKPVPGAISLKAVDEAVYSVLAQQSGMEQTFFLLEQELLAPVYAIYPGWSPAMFTELPVAERAQFEQALFARTARHAEGEAALPMAFFLGAGTGVETESMRASPNVSSQIDGPPAELARQASPFTLAATSFREKLREVNARRQAGLVGVSIAWLSLTVLGLLALSIAYPRGCLVVAGAAFATLGCFVALLLWSLFLLLLGCSQAQPEAKDAGTAAAKTESPTPPPAATTRPAVEPRLRQWFPETLLWRPELITDDRGEATLEMELADSITTWRLTTSAVSGAGQLGGADFPIKVFQPFFVDFNLPASLTRNDEVGVPVVVYNYLDKPQKVELVLRSADWFQRLDGEAKDQTPTGEKLDIDREGELTLELVPGEVRSLAFPLRVLRVGVHQLEVTATGSGVADAVRREVEVVPNGVPVERVHSGTLTEPFSAELAPPADAIEGSVRAVVKLYPSNFSQLVEGLDAIFQMPYGCFEQTSSTTYPNVLALDYLQRTGKSAPQVMAKARQYIHLGYQRLVSFETPGGGFDWFGNPPANRTLTAYGLMEFDDMAKIHDVDPQLIERTRQWLLAQRDRDGSWKPESYRIHEGLADDGGERLVATAYIAWAVFRNGQLADRAANTLEYLLSHAPDSIADPYALAVTANAIAAIDRRHGRLDEYLARLDDMKKSNADGKQAWWEKSPEGRTSFYGCGQAGDIETTAMATLALLRSGQHPLTTRAALAWLVAQKDPRGTWYSTQATVLALQALLEGTGVPLGGERERRIDIVLDGETVQRLVVPPDQSEVMQQISLSGRLKPGQRHQVRLTDRTGTAVAYQLTFGYHVDSAATPREAEPLGVDVAYDRQRLNVDDTVAAIATVRNNMSAAAPMVILDLPVPGGFAIDAGDLDELVGSRKIAKYQITARKAIVYLRRLEAGESLQLRYRLRATMPVKVAVPPAEAYEYYNPQRRGNSAGFRLEAVPSRA